MRILNRFNLPSAFVEVAEKNLRDAPTDGRYSVTEILKPVKEIILWRREYSVTEQDVSELINAMFGTAFHLMFEQVGSGEAEVEVETEIESGVVLSGRIDRIEDFTVVDYKTTTVAKFQRGDFDDYKKQGLMYAWLLRRNGRYIERVKVHMILKDFSLVRAQKDSSYPSLQIQTYEYEIKAGDMDAIGQWIEERLGTLEQMKDYAVERLPLPTLEESWYTGDTYAAMKNHRASAARLFDNEHDAMSMVATGAADYVVKREGIHMKCLYSEFFKYRVMEEK